MHLAGHLIVQLKRILGKIQDLEAVQDRKKFAEVTEQSSAQQPVIPGAAQRGLRSSVFCSMNFSSIFTPWKALPGYAVSHYKSVGRRPYFTCPTLIYRSKSGTSAPPVTTISTSNTLSAIALASITSPRHKIFALR